VKYSDLQVWQKAIDLVVEVYSLAKDLPQEEKFALTSQMRRAAVSIPANIAEGHGRKATNAFLNHLSIANGSLVELETLIEIARRLGYLDGQRANHVRDTTAEIGRMLNGLKGSLNPRSPSSRTS